MLLPFQRWGADRPRPRSLAFWLTALLVANLLVASGSPPAAAATGSVAWSGPDDAVSAKAKKPKKKCKKGYKLVRVKVERKRHGKTVTVKVKKCKKKPKAKAKPTPAPAPNPAPLPNPTPSPAPAPEPPPPASAPRIDEIVGWSTLGVAPATPPADLVPNGGTITSCPNDDRLVVYVRLSGFTSPGLVSDAWRRDGTVLTSRTVGALTDGPHNFFLRDNTPPLLNGVYDITWSHGGATIGTASVTRSC